MKYLKYAAAVILSIATLLYIPTHVLHIKGQNEFGATGISIKWHLPVGSDSHFKDAICRELMPTDIKITLQNEDVGQRVFFYPNETDASVANPTACSISEVGIWGIPTAQPEDARINVVNKDGVPIFSGTGSVKALKDGQFRRSGAINLTFNGKDNIRPVNLTGDSAINSGKTTTTKKKVHIEVSATDDRGVTSYLVSEKTVPTTSPKAWTSITPSMTFKKKIQYLLSDGEGLKTISVWFKDAAGNISSGVSNSITYEIGDIIPPVNRTNPDFPDYEPLIQSTGELLLKVAATDNIAVTGYFISTSSKTPGPENPGWKSLAFPSPEFSNFVSIGVKKFAKTQSLNIWFIDKAGNISNRVTGVVKRRELPPAPIVETDNVPPENLTKQDFIDEGSRETTNNVLTLKLAASDSGEGVAGYLIANGNKAPTSETEGWTMVKPVNNFSVTVGITVSRKPEEKDVYVWFKDLSGNVSTSVKGSILLLDSDITPPINTTPDNFINSGNSVSSSSTVFLSIESSDKGGKISGYWISESAEIPPVFSKEWIQVVHTKKFANKAKFELSANNGKKTVYVWFKDVAGNISRVKSDSIQKQVLKKLPDTGQRQQFTDTFFFGEDADYKGIPMGFIDNRDGTVQDNVTGLIWQNSIAPTSKPWVEAVEYCNNLVFGNKSLNSWRLPTVSELFSLIDFGEISPTINRKYFPGTMQDFYWTSTQYAAFPQMAWYVDFNFGTSGYYRMKTNHYYVRCVHNER